MAALDADDVLAALAALGHDWTPAKIAYKQTIAHDTVTLYDPRWTPVTVQAPYVEAYNAKTGWRSPDDRPTIALTGTAITDGVAEAEIVSGSETLILTLTGGVWPDEGDDFNGIRQSIIDGMDSAQAEAGGWDAKVKAVAAETIVERTSATVVTITLPATGDYAITADETITITIPANIVTADGTLYPFEVAGGSFVITNGE